VAVVAVGTLGDYASAEQKYVERDATPRERLPLTDVAFTGRWGRPATF
jgi:hypothetical protein